MVQYGKAIWSGCRDYPCYWTNMDCTETSGVLQWLHDADKCANIFDVEVTEEDIQSVAIQLKIMLAEESTSVSSGNAPGDQLVPKQIEFRYA